jgi:Secretion system C-terminal sorting domain
MKQLFASSVILLFIMGSTAFGWGGNTHKFIGKEFGKHIPPSMGFVLRNIDAISAHSSDPDGRKNSSHPLEEFKHYMDQDVYPEFFTGTLTHNLDSLFRQHDSITVTNDGILPWAIAWTFDSLVVAFKAQDSSKLILYLSDLSHYVADATQPLHVTTNYDGKLTGQSGLHSRYESTMMNAYLSTITIVPAGVSLITRPIIDVAFDLQAATYIYVDSVLHADAVAKVVAGGTTSGTTYLASMWSQTQSLTVKQLQLATEEIASLVYTAAVRAGMPIRVENQTISASGFVLDQNYPNPFNPSTHIEYQLERAGFVRLTVYDALGREVESLVDRQQEAGYKSVQWNAGRFSSGVYLYRLTVTDSRGQQSYSAVRRMSIVK